MQTRPCPDCDKFMIRLATGSVLTAYPPAYEMVWRCACGRIDDAGSERDRADEERFLQLWRMANEADFQPRNG